jgi:hypothetical protein
VDVEVSIEEEAVDPAKNEVGFGVLATAFPPTLNDSIVVTKDFEASIS